MRFAWLADVADDIRFGYRMLWRSPRFECTALLTLALGIGANTAMFSVADGLTPWPPPLQYSDRLCRIYHVNAKPAVHDGRRSQADRHWGSSGIRRHRISGWRMDCGDV